MNKVILMGRLTRDPDIRYSNGENSTAVARYTLAVDRRFKREGENETADFISCVVFGRSAEFAEKYLRKGTKIAVTGRIQTGSYTNREGQKVYTTDVIVEEQEFCEPKGEQGFRTGGSEDGRGKNYAAAASATGGGSGAGNSGGNAGAKPEVDDAGFMHIPDGIDEELPFN